jgi:hypothetical protein
MFVDYTATGDPHTLPITRRDAHGGWIAAAFDMARLA